MRKIFTVILILTSSVMLPCKCLYYNFRQQCRHATEIFVGQVIKVKQLDRTQLGSVPTEVTIVVEHVWKGSTKDTVIFKYSNYACDDNLFLVNQKYIVYSKNNHAEFCSGRTSPIKNNKDVRRLNFKYRHKKYKHISET